MMSDWAEAQAHSDDGENDNDDADQETLSRGPTALS